MKPNDFEKKLRRQPLRQIPTEWREEILAAASEAGTARRAVRLEDRTSTGRTGRASLPGWLERILWPNPQAWAGLAAIWILIFAMNFLARDTSPVVAEKSSPPPAEVIVELKQQQRLLAELIGPSETHTPGQSKIFDRQPRSERRFEILTT